MSYLRGKTIKYVKPAPPPPPKKTPKTNTKKTQP